jgi:hypothetical protein
MVTEFYSKKEIRIQVMVPGKLPEDTWSLEKHQRRQQFRHLLEGKTYPSQTTESKIGSAIETTPILPGVGAEALQPDPTTPQTRHVRDLRPDVQESVG